MYTLTSYCKVHALLMNVLYTGHISVHMHISYVLGYILRVGAGSGIGLKWIVSVCNIIGHQEVVLWAPTFPTHLDPPSSYHQLVEEWGWGSFICVVCTYVHLHPSTAIGGITLDRVISFAKYPTKILPKANKSKGNVMFKDDLIQIY